MLHNHCLSCSLARLYNYIAQSLHLWRIVVLLIWYTGQNALVLVSQALLRYHITPVTMPGVNYFSITLGVSLTIQVANISDTFQLCPAYFVGRAMI